MPDDQVLTAHIRRLSTAGTTLYVRLDLADLQQLGLADRARIRLDLGDVTLPGIVRTSGGSPWLAPGELSNAELTRRMRHAGLEHGDEVRARVVKIEGGSAATSEAVESGRANQLDTAAAEVVDTEDRAAIAAVQAYNRGRYRGRPNLELDREGYERFRNGLPRDPEVLVDSLRFVGEDYGGAQVRFLPHSYTEEAAQIAERLFPVAEQFTNVVRELPPLELEVPGLEAIEFLMRPFEGNKRWPVWASKALHFMRPDVFPILDSRAKGALGMKNLGGSPAEYRRFCIAIRDAIRSRRKLLAAAREVDEGSSPSDLKLLDKVLYQVGNITK